MKKPLRRSPGFIFTSLPLDLHVWDSLSLFFFCFLFFVLFLFLELGTNRLCPHQALETTAVTFSADLMKSSAVPA